MRLIPILLVIAGLGLGCARLNSDDFRHKGGTYQTINQQTLEKAFEDCRVNYSASAEGVYQEGDARTMECYTQRCMTAKGFIYDGMIDWCTER